MAVVLLDNLPLPSLKSYTIGSLLLFILATIYGYNFNNEISDDIDQNVWQIITSCMAKDPFCTWSTVNMVYCGFFLIGKIIQRFVFGDLRPIELQHIKDKFWNFIFYKFIFIFGVLNVQQMNEAMLWCAWFTIIGFFQLFTQLCYDRFQYLCYSPSTTNIQHGKVVALLTGIIFSCCALTGLSLYVGQQKDIHVFFFLFCEVSLLSLKVLHLATKYTIHLLDLKSNSALQNHKTIAYYSDIGFDMTILIVDIVYHIYMLIYSNIFLSMASLVLCMQLRSLFHDIKHRLAKHRKIIRVRKIVGQRFENASVEMLEELSDNKCAICWESMQKAKKLKCGHLFHSDCLCSWLVHDSSCPTCRHSLEEEMKDPSEQGDRLPRRALLRNHFFHFDGRQIASWFPSFSVEVLHTRVANELTQIPESRIDTMAHEVQAIFPNVPIHVIRADLTRTHSVDITSDNILEGNIHIPAAPALEDVTGDDTTLVEEQETPVDTPEEDERQATVSEDIVVLEEREAEDTSSRSRASERGTFGVDFAEQTGQRQTSLTDRKQQMLQNARRRYLEKKP
ncbi:E3 ubiquitin-protein ligase AMFR-like [Dendronephthya gigantea]|uniref:E3 ubiquitin-protein ligase AMFR-like n=1 Tax=Dendronephthya gigantea TaxID=151771 RepID=UPI00106B84A4|nr:E3 ubiquitin-protein ligase AMFR-like [Dendronephthya gigantea]